MYNIGLVKMKTTLLLKKGCCYVIRCLLTDSYVVCPVFLPLEYFESVGER